jgi:hypothetical protein
MEEPESFVRILRDIAKENKLALALTKLLTRDKMKRSTKPSALIHALCDFGDEVADVKPASTLMHPLLALRHLAQFHIENLTDSKNRLKVLCIAISGSDSVHLPVYLAEAEDYSEYQFDNAEENMKHEIAPHLERPDVEILNELVCEKVEQAAKHNSVKLTPTWTHSLRWYIQYNTERVKLYGSVLLTSPESIAVVLCVVVNPEAFERYDVKNPNGHFAIAPMALARMIGITKINDAIDIHEKQLKELSLDIAKRVNQYKDMQEKFGNAPITNIQQEV